jgi:hypothetical protein
VSRRAPTSTAGDPTEGSREASTRIGLMSDHTERLRKLRDRILAAKEFL